MKKIEQDVEKDSAIVLGQGIAMIDKVRKSLWG
jgi:hypothetical protein